MTIVVQTGGLGFVVWAVATDGTILGPGEPINAELRPFDEERFLMAFQFEFHTDHEITVDEVRVAVEGTNRTKQIKMVRCGARDTLILNYDMYCRWDPVDESLNGGKRSHVSFWQRLRGET